MLRIGMLLADRYEILQQIGSGGMAYVYRAKDHKLNRYVAIKVLKEEYCKDKNFVTKFRMEAQAAAGLSHANIVGVYDVGEINSVYFIVMELIEGITLKEYITRKKKLSVKESIGVAIQVAQGLEEAHNRHLIHRDIKPQNIIISRDGKIKVTDFGIARAITDETTNMYKAAGSVHYISPEQARGGYCDERSDIYSLGITMYEMVTGRVPFDGETTVAIAIAHMNEAIVPPSQIEPSIPIALEQIILKCVQKRPEGRYSSCEELIADLRQAIVTPQDEFVRFAAGEEGEYIQADEERAVKEQSAQPATHDTIRITPLPVCNVQSVRPESHPQEEYAAARQRRNGAPRNPAKNQGAPRKNPDRGSRDYREDPRRNDSSVRRQSPRKNIEQREPVRKSNLPATVFDRVLVALGSIFGLVILVMCVYIGVSVVGLLGPESGGGKKLTPVKTSEAGTDVTEEKTGEPQTEKETGTEKETLSDKQTKVPNLLGCTIEEATSLLNEAGLQIHVSSAFGYSDEYGEGLICKQQYAKDTIVNKKTKVTVTLSVGSNKFYLDGSKYIQSAFSILQYDLNSYDEIEVETISTPDETTKKNTVLKLEPESGYLAPGDKLTVYLSEGPTKIDLIDVSNLSKEQAISALEGQGLYVNSIAEDYSSTVAQGLVCGQNPAPYTTVNINSGVDIVISKGKPYYEVPSVWGMDEATARQTLESRHISCEVSWQPSGDVGAGQVFSQSVAAGQWVEEWTVVQIVVSTGPQTFEVNVECVKDMTQDEAIAHLQSLGLVVETITSAPNQWVAAGRASRIWTKSWSTTVQKGEGVTLEISSGPQAPQMDTQATAQPQSDSEAAPAQ